MKISHRELTEEENNPTGVRTRKSRRSEDRVFPLMEEKKYTDIGLTNPGIRRREMADKK